MTSRKRWRENVAFVKAVRYPRDKLIHQCSVLYTHANRRCTYNLKAKPHRFSLPNSCDAPLRERGL